jgi:hypothetical protein
VQKRESCLKEGAGWVERAGGGFCKKGCALGKEEGVRAKTKRVKMSSEKMAPFETVNFRRESILSIHRQVSKKSESARVSNRSAKHDSKFVRERESERDSYSQPDTMTFKNKGKTIEFWMKRAKGVFEMKGFE